MTAEPLRFLLRRLRRVTDPVGDAAPSDGQLLERFVARHDEAAFELLVWRHGTMVLNLCRRVLRHEQDAEDAFQATFLVLARRAASISRREACASWLYKVAYRVALAARAVLASRQERERPCPDDVAAADAPDDLAWRELRPVLDEEVSRLPEKYRSAFVLCCLQGRTNAEAAQELGCPPGTVLSRLSRARERLRQRLLRRGVCLSGGLLALAVTEKGQAAAVTADLVTTTSQAANAVAAGKAVAAVASARAAALTEGVIRAMFVNKVKAALGVALVLGLAGLGAGLVGERLTASPPAAAEEKPRAKAAEEPPVPPADRKADPDDPTGAALRRRQSSRRLKEIGVALHKYREVNGHFPAPAIYDPNGKALLSWRVAILPFIEQDNLYKQFNLNEPWDSEHNKKLLAPMPAVFAPSGGRDKDKDRTYYQAIVGQGAGWEPRKELPIHAFLDGTSNTILVVEAATPVPWTKPEDLPFVPDQALPKFGGLFDGDFHALLADGVVIFASARADESHLRLAITRDDGIPFDFAKILADGGAPGGKLDLDDLPRQNRQLKEAVEAALKEVAKEKDELELMKARIASGAPKIDAKTAKLVKENAELRQALDRALEELDALRTERERLGQPSKPRPAKP